MAQGIMNENRS